ncbi:MAG TPA: DUF2442 domain-containing protein [Acidobacteriaceae bacterium]
MHSSLVSEDLIPVEVAVDEFMIRVKFNGGLEIATPVSRFPRLVRATPEQRAHWRLIGRGDGVHWPEVDEDISVRTLLSQPARKPVSRIEEVPALIGDLLKTTKRLNTLFKGRAFTPDGHLVGSIGEVVAEYIYGVLLEPSSTPQVDAHTQDGRSVQIKLTGANGNSFGFRWSNLAPRKPAEILLALKLTDRGFEEIYNGRFPEELLRGRRDTSNGQISISLAKLRELNPSLLHHENTFESINRWFAAGFREVA